MQVRVRLQPLPPGVQHREEADLGAEVAGIGGDPPQRLGGGLEEQAIDGTLVLERQRREPIGQGEDDVEVLDGQELVEALLQPPLLGQRLALRTVPVAAGVVGVAQLAAAIADLEVAPEHGRAAGLDRPHDAVLLGRHHRTVSVTVGRTVEPEDVGHLPRWPGHQPDRSGSASSGLRTACSRSSDTWV